MTIAEAREEVSKCDQEIQSIKAVLRGIGKLVNSSETNELKITFTTVDGLPETAKPIIALQLSSPIDDGTLALGETIAFTGVETSMALITIEAKDADNTSIVLGTSSDPIEVATLCALDDPKNPKDEYTTDVPIVIVASTTATTKAEEETKKHTATDKEGEEATTTMVTAQPVVCTVTLKVTYKPSAKDQREELYDLLNKTSQRKATAMAELRELSTSSTAVTTTTTTKDPSVRSGFLNKGGGGSTKKGRSSNEEGGRENGNDGAAKKKGFVTTAKKWYERVTGPDSIARKTAFWAVVTKDFWIFFGAVGFFHFRGQVLALPPPV